MGYINIAVPFRGWTVIREIGHGGFGKVYEIRRDQYGIDERSAMKVIAVPQDSDEINAYLRDGYSPETLRKMYEGSRASIFREYQTMARLKDCPNIVRCEDIGIVMNPDGIGSKIYIRMELLTPIRKYRKLQSFNEEEVIKLGSDICKMLVRCEKEGIVHRDIKPENIMVSNNGDYKLGDFGIARFMDHSTMATKIGTINYMAPEVYLGRKYGHAADIYSLGLVLYWLLNNRRMPFFPQEDSLIKNDSAVVAQEQRMTGAPIPRPVNGSPGLSNIVFKALAYDPADRYQSALEFGNAIRNCLSEEKASERSYVGENDSTERFNGYENETIEDYFQNSTGVNAETTPLDKENERQRQYEKRYARQRKIEEIKAKEEADRLERERQAEERRIAAEKADKKRKRTIIAIVTPIIISCITFLIVLITVIIPSHNNDASYKQMFSDANVGSSVFFGSYEQDNNTSNGREDIEWLVLAKEGDRALVISKYTLDYQKYNSTDTDVTWDTCSLRKWLNSEFLNVAFSEDERAIIPSMTVSADRNPNYSTSPGNTTTDKVFLLSITEAEKYFTSDSARQCQETTYCNVRGGNKTRASRHWWLRSPGGDADLAAYVFYDGSVIAYGNYVHNGNAVRPALWVDFGS